MIRVFLTNGTTVDVPKSDSAMFIIPTAYKETPRPELTALEVTSAESARHEVVASFPKENVIGWMFVEDEK